MVLPLWRSLHSLNLMLPKEDRKAMLLRLYNEDTPLMDHSKDRFHNKAQAGANANADADIKDESVDIKEEEEEEEEAREEEEGVDADVKDEMAATKGEEGEEGGGANVADAGEVGDVEMTESGAMAEDDGESERVKEDDALHDAVVKSEAEHR